MDNLHATRHVNKTYNPYEKLCMCVLAVMVVLPLSCSHRRHFAPLSGLIDTWKTERGILIEVHTSSPDEAEAVIKLTPGYRGDDMKIGKVLISHIKPQPSGGFSGSFEMPGELEPITVDISIIMNNTLLIISGDKRLRGKKMLWKRIVNKRGY